MDPLVNDLLTELKNEGWTRQGSDFNQKANQQLYTILQREDSRLSTTEATYKAFDSKTSFEQTSKLLIGLGVGYTSNNVSNLWIYSLLGIFASETEIMRQYILEILANRPPFDWNRFITLGTLVNGIRDNCLNFGAKFADEIDVELRNSLAHETYWIVQDAKVTPPKFKLRYVGKLGDVEKEQLLGAVIFRGRQQNILTTIIAKQIQEKYNNGWFS